MDDNLVYSGIDAYAKVEFAGNPALKTKVHTLPHTHTHAHGSMYSASEQPTAGHTQVVSQKGKANIAVTINQSLFLPVMVPTMTNRIAVSVWDHDTVGNNAARAPSFPPPPRHGNTCSHAPFSLQARMR